MLWALLLQVLAWFRARQGPRGAHLGLEIVCNNSPEFWRLFVEEKAREGRAKTSKADLIGCRGGGP